MTAELAFVFKGTDQTGQAAQSAAGNLGSVGQAAQSAGGLLGGLGGIVSGGLSVALGGIFTDALSGATGAIGNFFGKALDAEAITQRLDFALSKQGATAAITKQGALDLAQSMKGLAGGSEETVESAEAVLLKFQTIGKDTFPDALQASADLAAQMGISMPAAAQLLGKTLEVPGAGLARLKAAGVEVTTQFQDQIKAMEASGDTAGAQKLILEALAQTTGGAAASAAGTLKGQWEIMSNELQDAGKGILTQLLPTLHSLFDDVIKPAIPVVEEIAGKIATMIAALTTGDATKIGAAFGDLSSTFAGLWAKVEPVLNGFIKSALAWVQAQLPGWMVQLQTWGQQFIAWIGPMIPPFLLELGKLEVQFVTWLAAQVPPLTAQLAAWGRELWAWVAPMIPPLVAEAGKLAGQLWAWIQAQVPPLIAQLLLWGQEFFKWVGPMIPPLLTELGKLLGQLVAWVWGTAVPAVIKAVADWAAAFADWVMKPGGAKDQLLPALSGFLLAVGKFVVSDLVPGFVGFAKSFIDGLLSGFNTNLPTLVSNVEGMGKSIISGIVSGINAAPGAVLAALGNIVDGAIASIKARLGINSPSTVFAEMGHNMMAGMALGIRGSASMPASGMQAAAGQVLNTTRQTVNKYFTLNSQVTPVTGTIGGDFDVMQAMERAFA